MEGAGAQLAEDAIGISHKANPADVVDMQPDLCVHSFLDGLLLDNATTGEFFRIQLYTHRFQLLTHGFTRHHMGIADAWVLSLRRKNSP
eukprot:CAMPEP_0180508482 /NCGR_PEP_ID=MMETSP1036_2-20121128/49195_1 /TAXON_ID=632150 /ORGANISM="Azadinium spinosum, Strain 3D9" /LENGTH=88 /DNA_ID=CAMNT_0022518791 /DNA_START=408 /DNA_END=671 /DNA_ORIENTATION=-